MSSRKMSNRALLFPGLVFAVTFIFVSITSILSASDDGANQQTIGSLEQTIEYAASPGDMELLHQLESRSPAME